MSTVQLHLPEHPKHCLARPPAPQARRSFRAALCGLRRKSQLVKTGSKQVSIQGFSTVPETGVYMALMNEANIQI